MPGVFGGGRLAVRLARTRIPFQGMSADKEAVDLDLEALGCLWERNLLALGKGPVLRVAVFQVELIVFADKLSMKARDRRLLEDQLVARFPPYRIHRLLAREIDDEVSDELLRAFLEQVDGHIGPILVRRILENVLQLSIDLDLLRKSLLTDLALNACQVAKYYIVVQVLLLACLMKPLDDALKVKRVLP